MPKLDACQWCGKLLNRENVPDDSVVVCSVECAKREDWFRRTYSDEKIGERNYRDHGVNPNHRGGRCTGE